METTSVSAIFLRWGPPKKAAEQLAGYKVGKMGNSCGIALKRDYDQDLQHFCVSTEKQSKITRHDPTGPFCHVLIESEYFSPRNLDSLRFAINRHVPVAWLQCSKARLHVTSFSQQAKRAQG